MILYCGHLIYQVETFTNASNKYRRPIPYQEIESPIYPGRLSIIIELIRINSAVSYITAYQYLNPYPVKRFYILPLKVKQFEGVKHSKNLIRMILPINFRRRNAYLYI